MLKTCATVRGKRAFLQGLVEKSSTFKIALYTEEAELGASTVLLPKAGEVSGQNYERKPVGSPVYSEDEEFAYFGFSGTVEWKNSSISARGAAIYVEELNKLVLFVVDFGKLVSSTNDSFKVELVEKMFRI